MLQCAPITRMARVPMACMTAMLTAAMLAGCSQSEPPADVPVTTEDAAAPAPESAAGETVGGDGSQIQLDALTESDLQEAALSGELACSFSTGDAPPILFAMGIVGSHEPAQGVVKVSGHVEQIRAPGGFDGMLANPTFTGQGKTIGIAMTGPASGGGESPPRPATLTYARADGASRSFDGIWQCGP